MTGALRVLQHAGAHGLRRPPLRRRLLNFLARPPVRYAGLFLLAALLSGIRILHGINPHDEGLMLQAAARVVDGELPYRDFYLNYAPAQPYLLGGLNELFGPSLLVWRLLRVALDATVATLAYALTRRHATEPLALLAWLAVAAAMAYPTTPGPNPPAVALGLGAVLLAERSPLGAGALGGAAVAFRVDFGIAAAAGAVLASRPGARSRAAGVAIAVGALVLAPFVIPDPSAFWQQTIAFGFREQRLQRLPLPGAWHGGFEPNKILEHYLPYVLLAGAAMWTAVALRERPSSRAWSLAPFAAAGVGYLLARADEFHYVPLTAVLPVLLATAAAVERRAGRSTVATTLVVFVSVIAFNGLDRKRVQALYPPTTRVIHVDVADGVRAPAAEAHALDELVPYVRTRVPPGRPIFVANPRHDLVKVGNPLLYVLANRPNPTRYDVMQPGVVTTASVQREIVADLERTRPRLVIRWLSPVASKPEPNGAGRSTGVRTLDRYLARSYLEVRRFGDYAVLRRRMP